MLPQTAGELGGAGGATPNFNGGYNVTEGFGELIVPLVQDKPGIESLTADGGVRYSSYQVDAAGNPHSTQRPIRVSWPTLRATG